MTLFEKVLFAYFAIAVLYTLILAIAGLFKKPLVLLKEDKHRKIAILVPAYKEDSVILQVAKSHLNLNYPRQDFEVVVIADSLKKATLDELKKLDIKTIEVSFQKSTKSKALNAAFEILDADFEIALICDADNVLEKDFLLKINSAYSQGHQTIQAKRVAKNLNTSYAVLDGASELINNHLFRKAYNALGLSSSLIGSGMAFNYQKLRSLFKSINAVGGFDKILQLKLIESGEKIYFLSNALVYDEKIDSSQAFQHQRKRWLHSQFSYAAKYFFPGLKALLKGNLDYFNLAVVYFLFPTRMLLLGILCSLALLFTLLSFNFEVIYQPWWILVFAYCLALGICLPLNYYNKNLFKAIFNLPMVFIRTFSLLFKLKGADKTFIHTTHSNPEVTNSLHRPNES